MTKRTYTEEEVRALIEMFTEELNKFRGDPEQLGDPDRELDADLQAIALVEQTLARNAEGFAALLPSNYSTAVSLVIALVGLLELLAGSNPALPGELDRLRQGFLAGLGDA